MISCPGAWKNFDDIEENLTVEELRQILDSFRELERNRLKAAAALKGIDLDKNESAESAFDRIKMRAEARARGVSEEEYELSMIGIGVEEFDE